MSIKIIANNKRAYHDYFINAQYECGLVLVGTEIKAIRQGKVNIKEAYVQIKQGELLCIGMNIGLYEQGNRFNHEEMRDRKLLMHKEEIRKLEKEVSIKGFTLVPLKLYLKEGKAKLEIGLAKGKHLFDKRASEKERDIKREIQKEYKVR